ncbi:MAG: DNA (cytosine-5-)-methyltransferase [Chromatiaceae bacterium]|nr:DNA (cytosine-5-)-methyltransferase [Chromatiaceae bacterium]HPE79764.1 DNA (cytosine-5-)-methyltransferase [Gammaproteobacteria bacterium]
MNGTRSKKSEPAIVRKWKRLRDGGEPRVLDLFAGCGGISLGFRSAGFEILGAAEIDKDAARTHGINFFGNGYSEGHESSRDVHDEPSGLFSDLKVRSSPENVVDVLVGGPPCQAFARIGRAKLRSEARRLNSRSADEAFLNDERADLVWQYLRIVQETKPLVILIENVPDMLNFGGQNVAELVCEELDRQGYSAGYTLLNSVFYGVPQTRERMFLLAYRKELGVAVRWPKPTHYFDLPRGYDGTRATALKHILKFDEKGLLEDIEHNFHHFQFPSPDDFLVSAVSAKDALADLPRILALRDFQAGCLRRGVRDLSTTQRYTQDASSGYAALMREWPGFSSDQAVTGHVIRYLPRDFKIFRMMKPGWQYPQIWERVEQEKKKLLARRSRVGLSTKMSDPEVRRLTEEWTLPYDKSKFPNKWWKLRADEPSRTLLAHLGKDSYSHIHYESAQARTISVREAARLQSFPDGFHFSGGMNAAFRQIGNAVPPLVSYSIAREVRCSLGLPLLPDIRDGYLWDAGSENAHREKREKACNF